MENTTPFMITSKRDGIHFYMHLMNDEIKDIKMPKKCENEKDLMKCLKDYFYVREGGEWKSSKLNGGVGFYYAA